MTDEPMESGPLPISSHSESHDAMVIRNRRLMRREYSRSYIDARPLPPPEPVLEQSHFAPSSDDAAQAEFLSKRDPARDQYAYSFTHGFLTALACVAVITGLLLWKVL